MRNWKAIEHRPRAAAGSAKPTSTPEKKCKNVLTKWQNLFLTTFLIFGINNVETKNEVVESSVESVSDDSGHSLEEKISHLARQLINGVIWEAKEPRDVDSTRSSSGSSFVSTGSSMSVLALRVVRSILGTVDPNTGKSIKEHTTSCESLQDKVAKLSALVVEEVIKEKRKQTGVNVDSNGYAELEEKISKLALNIVTSTIEGKRPHSTSSTSSLCSAELEERVIELSAHIVGGIISLKKSFQKTADAGNHQISNLVSNSVERVLREIFNLDALANAPTNVLQRVTERDVRRLSDDIARRLVPPRDDSSAMSSGMSKLAEALTGEAMAKLMDSNESTVGSSMSNAVTALADTIVVETLTDQQLLSDESKLSSAISEIAQVITDSALESKLSSQSAMSSGASRLAGAVIGETVSNAIDQTVKSSTESVINSGISDLADTTVDETVHRACIVDSSTKSAISSGIKMLAEKITQQALDMAAADPEGIGSSTRSAISSGASQLALHIAQMITGQGSISASTLESVLSSAVSDLVADMITRQVLQKIGEKDNSIQTPHLANEITRLVQNILGVHTSESKTSKTSLDTRSSKDVSSSSALESGVSDLASDVVKELLLTKDSEERPSDESAASAISAVAARYVHEVLGVVIDDIKVEDDIIPVHVQSFHAVPPNRSSEDLSNTQSVVQKRSTDQIPHPPRTQKTHHRKGARKVRTKMRGMSTGSLLQTESKPTRRHTNFASSFTDWRNNANNTRGKSLNQLQENHAQQYKLSSQTQFAGDLCAGTTSSEDFNNVMESLAARIVASVVLRHNEDEQPQSEIAQDLNESNSVEHLVGSLALGVVTSLLGLDVLSETGPVDANLSPSRDDGTQQSHQHIGTNENEAEDAPGPSAGANVKQNNVAENINNVKQKSEDHTQPIPKILSILCSEDGADLSDKKETGVRYCEDSAVEHPHRVRSPSTKDREMRLRAKKKIAPVSGNTTFHSSGKDKTISKAHRRKKSNSSSFESTPLKPSAGFINRQSIEDRHSRHCRPNEYSDAKFLGKTTEKL
uniref:uncharacterized protein LOC120328681 n=1 Tax=Styela clava TaxID=7725 RepID=UPI00193A875D|nr:uncharacterized protein LOC120328681 [Styela clava]